MAGKSRTRWVVISVLGAALAGLVAFLFAPRPLAVEAAAVTRGPIAETVQDLGEARVRQDFIVAAPVAGLVERAPLEVGDPIKAGVTVVARLRPANPAFLDSRARAQAEAAVAAAQAAVSAATQDRARLNAEAVRARIFYQRSAPLGPSGEISRQAVDDARAAADAAGAAVHAADALLLARRADLASARAVVEGARDATGEQITLMAPTSGVVTQLPSQSERTVAAGAPLIEIGAVGGLEAQIEFLSQDAVRIRPGMRAEIYNWGGPATIPARVRLVQPSGYTKVSALGVEEQRALVMLQLEGPRSGWAGLAPGYRLWGRVFLRELPSAVLAPIGALVRIDDGWAVFRIEAGKARLRLVRVGLLTDRWAEILDGVAPGDRLIDYPSDQIRDGVRVTARGAP